MKLDEFVANVLKDIDKGLLEAKTGTDRGYNLPYDKGVDFDIAVTTTYSDETSVEGKAKVGIVEVLGAGVSTKINGKNEKSEVSRVKFTVRVPNMTQKEDAELQMQMEADHEQRMRMASEAANLY